MRTINIIASQYKQKGVAAVEFALVALILFTLLFGIMEMGRILFMMNTTAEATRLGARLAVVCNENDLIIEAKMLDMAGFLDGHINVAYNSCPEPISSAICSVTVSIDNLPIQSVVSLIPLPSDFTMPAFATTLPRESMSSTNNPICS